MSDYTPLKRCRTCGAEKPLTPEYFRRSVHSPDGYAHYCKACIKAQEQSNRRRHGIPPRNSPDPDGMKFCTVCGQRLPVDHFYKRKDGSLKPLCKNCAREQTKAWRAKNIERERAKARDRYWSNRAQVLSYKKKLRAIHPDYNREYRKANRARFVAIDHRRRARKKSLPNTFTAEQWRAALEYFDNKCAVCRCSEGNGRIIACDHWIPVQYSGDDNPGTVAWNIVPLCHGVGGCNNRKRHKLPYDWLCSEYEQSEVERIMNRIDAYFAEVRNGKG